jgi:haloalkane dehalogenase
MNVKTIKDFLASIGLVLLSLGMLVGCSRTRVPEFPLADAGLPVLTTTEGIEYVQTPDEFFSDLPDWPYEAQYVTIDGLRQAYVDVGDKDAEPVLLLHGQPSWSYLYRHMIPVLADAGYRVIAMDHLGMGRSDKPIDLEYHSYANHVYRLERFVEELELTNITAFVQDWGSLIGLNVIGNHPERFARVVVGDGALPQFAEDEIPFPLPADVDRAIKTFGKTIGRIPAQQTEFYTKDGQLKPLLARRSGGTEQGTEYFGNWILFARHKEDFRPSTILEAMTYYPLTVEVKAAYDAPFPARIAMAAPRTFPGLVNELGGATDLAWVGLESFEKPFLTIWAGNDPGQLGRSEVQQILIDRIPGAQGQPHTRLDQASHFLQDDQGAEIARRMIDFMQANPVE